MIQLPETRGPWQTGSPPVGGFVLSGCCLSEPIQIDLKYWDVNIFLPA